MSGWVKLPLDVVLSEKFTALAPALHSVWLRAWVLAKKCNADGLLVDNGQPLALARLATPDVPPRKVARAVEQLHALGFFDCRAGGAIEVLGWKRAQFGGPSGERMARQRTVTSDVTSDGINDEIPQEKSVTCDAEKPQNGVKKASHVTPRAREIPSSSDSKLSSSSGAAAQEKTVTCDAQIPQNGAKKASHVTPRATEIPSSSDSKLSSSSGAAAPEKTVTCDAQIPPLAAPSTLPQWVEQIREDVRLFADVLLVKLSFEQRLGLGQYAAFRWSGYTQDETKNLEKARAFAGQIEAIGTKHRFREVSVREFIAAGNRFFEQTRRLRLYSLWPIGAAIEESAVQV